jgi:hypothetical protein
MMKQINQMLRRKILVVTLAAVICVSLASVFAYCSQPKPIIVYFASPFPTEVMIQTEYSLKVSWQNTNKKNAYDGYFLFVVKGKGFKIAGANVKFTFAGSVITPQQSDDLLYFHLPRQKFPAGKTGTISVGIVYNRAGMYNWQIGIAQS